MGHLRVYIAMTLDGFVADTNGDVGFLDAYSHGGFEEFFDTVGTLIIGRHTLDQAIGFGPWPYGDRKTIVLTSRKLPTVPGANLNRGSGDLRTISDQLLEDDRDAWIVGGPRTIAQFATTVGIDLWDIFVIPELLGSGVRLFNDDRQSGQLQLLDSQRFDSGIVGLKYKTATG